MKIIKNIAAVFGLCATICALAAEKPIKWDDTVSKEWPQDFKIVEIPSSADGKTQRAYFRPANSAEPRPLIVSMHTWSADFAQTDALAQKVKAADFNYIRPNFRGANDTPEACGSDLTVSDVKDAIEFAVKNSKVDPKEIHIVGASGGGFATLNCYMRLNMDVKSFSAWVPISDLRAWYYESLWRNKKYARNILAATDSTPEKLNVDEMKKRSPYFYANPVRDRKDSQLFIYAGIHDGYTGSVPILHSIKMYNKLASAEGAKGEDLVSDSDAIEMLTFRDMPENTAKGEIGGRKIHCRKNFKNLHLTIFEGGHEMLPKSALDFVPAGK